MLVQKGWVQSCYKTDAHAIAYASKSLTTTQQNYAQMRLPLAAKNSMTMCGIPKITVETDHKPLETILTKPLHTAPARLQKMIMSIQKHPIHVIYKPGKELLIADTLSRAPLPDKATELEFQQYDINIIHLLPVTEPKLAEIQEETERDTALRDLHKTTQDGWPETKSDALPGAKPYWNFRDEVTNHHHGLLFKRNNIIIPASMQKEM